MVTGPNGARDELDARGNEPWRIGHEKQRRRRLIAIHQRTHPAKVGVPTPDICRKGNDEHRDVRALKGLCKTATFFLAAGIAIGARLAPTFDGGGAHAVTTYTQTNSCGALGGFQPINSATGYGYVN